MSGDVTTGSWAQLTIPSDALARATLTLAEAAGMGDPDGLHAVCRQVTLDLLRRSSWRRGPAAGQVAESAGPGAGAAAPADLSRRQECVQRLRPMYPEWTILALDAPLPADSAPGILICRHGSGAQDDGDVLATVPLRAVDGVDAFMRHLALDYERRMGDAVELAPIVRLWGQRPGVPDEHGQAFTAACLAAIPEPPDTEIIWVEGRATGTPWGRYGELKETVARYGGLPSRVALASRYVIREGTPPTPHAPGLVRAIEVLDWCLVAKPVARTEPTWPSQEEPL